MRVESRPENSRMRVKRKEAMHHGMPVETTESIVEGGRVGRRGDDAVTE